MGSIVRVMVISLVTDAGLLDVRVHRAMVYPMMMILSVLV